MSEDQVINPLGVTRYYPEKGQVELTVPLPQEKFLWNPDIQGIL
jgi:hypothetical protein